MSSCFNPIWLFATLWTVAHKAPLSMGFSRQEYWSGLPRPPPGDFPGLGMEPASPALAGGFFYHKWPLGSPSYTLSVLRYPPKSLSECGIIIKVKTWNGNITKISMSWEVNYIDMSYIFSSCRKQKSEQIGLQFSSVQSLSHVRLLQPHGLQHTRPRCPSRTPGVYSNSCPSSQWCHPIVSSSVIPFSSSLQSFPASFLRIFSKE